MQGIEESIYPKIEVAKNAKEAWDILEIAYQGTTKVKNVKLQTLRRNFEILFMKDINIVDQFMTQVNHIVNQLRIHGEDIPDQKVLEKVLTSLLEKYDMVVVAIEESKDMSQLFVDQLTGSLLSYEIGLRRGNNLLESAF